jgi:hypothetical protein
MAVRTWKGGAGTSAQVWKGTVTTTTVGHTYIVTLTDSNGGTIAITFAVTASETTTTLVAAAFVVAWNASLDGRVAAITASNSSGQIILTADTAGQPFSAAASGTGTWSGTGNTTSNSGPYDYDTAANWYEGAVPVAADNVIISGTGAIRYGLNQSGVAIAGFTVLPGSSVTIGYQGLPLRLDATSLTFAGTALAYITFGSTSMTARVLATATVTAPSSGLYLLGTGFATLRVEGGSVDVAGSPGQTSTITTAQTAGTGRVYIG